MKQVIACLTLLSIVSLWGFSRPQVMTSTVHHCTPNISHDRTEFDEGMDKESAWRFGALIQSILSNQDLKELCPLISSDLAPELYERCITNSEMESVFPRTWRKPIIESLPTCTPILAMQFALGDDSLRYEPVNGVWLITQTNEIK